MINVKMRNLLQCMYDSDQCVYMQPVPVCQPSISEEVRAIHRLAKDSASPGHQWPVGNAPVLSLGLTPRRGEGTLSQTRVPHRALVDSVVHSDRVILRTSSSDVSLSYRVTNLKKQKSTGDDTTC